MRIAMINGGCYLSKDEWRRKFWNIAWTKEDGMYKITCQSSFMYEIIDKPFLLNWWILSDLMPHIIGDCELMAKLVCNTSLLRDHDYRLKNLSFSHKVCIQCPLGIREDLMHFVMQSLDTQNMRNEMFAVINVIDDVYVIDILAEQPYIFYVMMCKHPPGVPFESVAKTWLVSCRYIAKTYRRLVTKW